MQQNTKYYYTERGSRSGYQKCNTLEINILIISLQQQYFAVKQHTFPSLSLAAAPFSPHAHTTTALENKQ